MDKPYAGMDKRLSKSECLNGIEKEWWEKEEEREEANKDNYKYAGRAKGFLIIPDEVVYAGKHMTHGAVRMWIAIFKHNWAKDEKDRACFPGRERLAIMCGISVVQADRLIGELKEKKVLIVEKRWGGLTNLYILHDPPKEWMEKTFAEIEKARQRKKEERMKSLEKHKKVLVDLTLSSKTRTRSSSDMRT